MRLALDVPNATLLGLPRLLQDEAYRNACVGFVRDPVVRAFKSHEFAAYPPKFREEAIAPVLNKVGRVLMTPAIRNIIAQPKSTIDLRFMMDDGRVLIANLSKGALGEGPAHLLGALLVTALAQVALSRRDVAKEARHPFHLYVDEFQSFSTSGFALILSEARKYGLTLTLAHQYLDQLPNSLREAVFGNVGSLIAFRTGAQDAPIIARQLDLPNPDQLRDLPNYHAWASIQTAGAPSSPMRIETFAPLGALHARSKHLKRHSRIRFGRPRDKVEKRIVDFFQR